MKIRRSQLKDTVAVATRTGEGAYGPVDAELRTVRCTIDERRRLVRDASGDETVSESTLLLHPHTAVYEDGVFVALVDPMAVFLPESPVTIGDRVSRVLAAKEHKVRSSVIVVEVTCA